MPPEPKTPQIAVRFDPSSDFREADEALCRLAGESLRAFGYTLTPPGEPWLTVTLDPYSYQDYAPALHGSKGRIPEKELEALLEEWRVLYGWPSTLTPPSRQRDLCTARVVALLQETLRLHVQEVRPPLANGEDSQILRVVAFERGLHAMTRYGSSPPADRAPGATTILKGACAVALRELTLGRLPLTREEQATLLAAVPKDDPAVNRELANVQTSLRASAAPPTGPETLDTRKYSGAPLTTPKDNGAPLTARKEVTQEGRFRIRRAAGRVWLIAADAVVAHFLRFALVGGGV